MLTILILTILGIIIGLITAYRDNYFSITNYLAYPFFYGFFGFILGIILATILPMDTYQKQYTLDIVTLQDNNGTRGIFVLGSGYTGGQMRYVFYYEENGYFKLVQVEHKSARTKYTDGKPKVIVTEKYPSESFLNYFAIDWDIHSKTYIFEVPRGTISTNFELDAK